MKAKTTYMMIAVLATVSAQAVVAAPIANQSIIEAVHFDYSDSNADEPGGYMVQSNGPAFSNTYISTPTSNVAVYGNLATGKVGGISSGWTGTEYESGIELYDTLTFSTANGQATTVSFNYSFDGIFSSYLGGEAGADYAVRIYDITSLTNWLEDDPFVGSIFPSFEPYMDVDVLNGAVSVFSGSIRFGLNDASVYHDLDFFDAVNSEQYAAMTKTGSFLADPSKKYGIFIFARVASVGAATADFMNTGSFEFTDLNGATFESASGQFLSESVAVPLPGALSMFSIGMLGLVTGRKLRRK